MRKSLTVYFRVLATSEISLGGGKGLCQFYVQFLIDMVHVY